MSRSDDDTDAATSSYESSPSPESSTDENHVNISPRSQSELLTLARRPYPGKDEEDLARQAKDLALESDMEYALDEMSCSVCHLDKTDFVPGRRVSVDNLSEECSFCEILRRCHQHFANGCSRMYVLSHRPGPNIRICFYEHLRYSVCTWNHVQLYSKELQVCDMPFRYAHDISESAVSDASIRVMKEWINRCSTTHQHASPIRGAKPTRLILLADNENGGAQLCSPEARVEYVALSYRWGSCKQSETTKKNVTNRYKELKTSDFPKTLRDAIQVTRRLGLKYIWIDRVCIIQDDQEDWATEASLMAGIYANAHVVLSATATEDCQDGFLRERPAPIVIQYAQRGQDACKVYARKSESHNCGGIWPKTEYSLFKRGWCMQERFLASRIIHFLPDEVVFECQAGRECECGGASAEPKRRYSDLVGYSKFARLQATQSMRGKKLIFNWTRVVQDYSEMKLTYGKDSLPALAGLASCVEHLKPGKYIAGIWEQDIGYQLGWFINPRSAKMRRWENPESIDILGPTFSWSSHVMGPVEFSSSHIFRCICTLKSFDIALETSNPYGQIRHAALCLSGWTVSGNDMVTWLKTFKRAEYYTQQVYLDSGLEFVFSRVIDPPSLDAGEREEPEKQPSWKSVLCFGLYEYKSYRYGPYTIDALLVQPSKTEEGKYVRIGVLRGLEKSWFIENAVASTITLV